jgi:hypothetical protein
MRRLVGLRLWLRRRLLHIVGRMPLLLDPPTTFQILLTTAEHRRNMRSAVSAGLIRLLEVVSEKSRAGVVARREALSGARLRVEATPLSRRVPLHPVHENAMNPMSSQPSQIVTPLSPLAVQRAQRRCLSLDTERPLA